MQKRAKTCTRRPGRGERKRAKTIRKEQKRSETSENDQNKKRRRAKKCKNERKRPKTIKNSASERSQCQIQHLRNKCCRMRWLSSQTELCEPLSWRSKDAKKEQKLFKQSKKDQKRAKTRVPRAVDAKSSIYARNAAECDGYRCKRSSVSPFCGDQKNAKRSSADRFRGHWARVPGIGPLL